MAAKSNGTMTLLLEIQKLTQEGKKLSPVVRDRLILSTMEAVLIRLNELDDRLGETKAEMETIKKSSIGLWFKNNPKLGVIVVSVVIILVNLWFVSDFRKPILVALGLDPGLLP